MNYFAINLNGKWKGKFKSTSTLFQVLIENNIHILGCCELKTYFNENSILFDGKFEIINHVGVGKKHDADFGLLLAVRSDYSHYFRKWHPSRNIECKHIIYTVHHDSKAIYGMIYVPVYDRIRKFYSIIYKCLFLDLTEITDIGYNLYILGDWNAHTGAIVGDYHYPKDENDFQFINFINNNKLLNLNSIYQKGIQFYTREKLTSKQTGHVSKSIIDYAITNDLSFNENIDNNKNFIVHNQDYVGSDHFGIAIYNFYKSDIREKLPTFISPYLVSLNKNMDKHKT